MAILSYKTADGQTVKVNSYKVNNLIPQQEKGDNPNLVMSQKAVTDEVNQIGLQIDEVTGKITAVKATADKAASDLTALTQTVNGKANANNVYTKAEADGKYLTASDITGKAEKSALEAEVTRATAKEGELNTAIGTKATASDLTAEVTRAKAAEKVNADKITALENLREIDCGKF